MFFKPKVAPEKPAAVEPEKVVAVAPVAPLVRARPEIVVDRRAAAIAARLARATGG